MLAHCVDAVQWIASLLDMRGLLFLLLGSELLWLRLGTTNTLHECGWPMTFQILTLLRNDYAAAMLQSLFSQDSAMTRTQVVLGTWVVSRRCGGDSE
eukprot:scaffold32044_cov30-Tisochrysis_lutea.AAC.6